MYLDDALRNISEEKFILSFPLGLRQTEFAGQENDLNFDRADVEERARYCSLDEDTIKQILKAAAEAEKSESLAIAAKAMFRSIYLMDGALAVPWLDFKNSLGELGGAMHLLIASGFVSLVRSWHRKAGISEHITKQTCSIIGVVNKTHIWGKGSPGIYFPGPFAWNRHYCDPDLYYLHFERFGFMSKKNYLPMTVYRKKSDGSYAVFPTENMNFDARGYALDRNPENTEKEFTSVFRIVDGFAEGNRVLEDGRTEKNVSKIDLSEYELFLGVNTPVLDMHIPAGGAMTPEIAEESFRKAKEFYSSLPDKSRHPKAVICSSWIFNPNLPEILPADSNLNKLLKRVHSTPVPCSPTDGLWFVFLHEGEFDVNAVPRDTALRRSVAEYIEKGNRWRVGGMFLPIDEIK